MTLTPSRLLIAAAAVLAGTAVTTAAAQTPPGPGPIPVDVPAVSFSWQRDAPPVTFTSFALKNVHEGSTVVVRCLTPSGGRCKGKLRNAFRAENVTGTVAVERFVGRRIRPGRRLEARIARPGSRTFYKTVTIRRTGTPSIVTECRAPGEVGRGPC